MKKFNYLELNINQKTNNSSRNILKKFMNKIKIKKDNFIKLFMELLLFQE